MEERKRKGYEVIGRMLLDGKSIDEILKTLKVEEAEKKKRGEVGLGEKRIYVDITRYEEKIRVNAEMGERGWVRARDIEVYIDNGSVKKTLERLYPGFSFTKSYGNALGYEIWRGDRND